jgi:hypothetical protein
LGIRSNFRNKYEIKYRYKCTISNTYIAKSN